MVNIYFNSLGINNSNQAYVQIYDLDKLIFEDNTYNGNIKVMLKPNKVYTLKAYFYGETIITSFYVKNNKNCFVFSFNHSLFNNSRNIIFRLTDYFYNNLPIERGELILWQQ